MQTISRNISEKVQRKQTNFTEYGDILDLKKLLFKVQNGLNHAYLWGYV